MPVRKPRDPEQIIQRDVNRILRALNAACQEAQDRFVQGLLDGSISKAE